VKVFLIQLSQANHVNYTIAGDFLVNHKFVFEIGGLNIQGKQIEDLGNAWLVKDQLEHRTRNLLPLWIFGFLY